MTRAKPWQFSVRTSVLIVLIAGPLIGAFAGTFGSSVQEVLISMALIFATSIVLGIISTLVAFVILSPLLVLEKSLRGTHYLRNDECRMTKDERKMTNDE